MNLPPSVRADPEQTVRELWAARLRQHTSDIYRGLPLLKMPEDLRVYQHVIEASRPSVIVEIGTFAGGSALWFADQLDTFCGGGHVYSIDNQQPAFRDPRISFIEADLVDARPGLAIASGERVMVVEDSAHVYATTAAALRLYADLVIPGCWFVVEDGIVDSPLSVWTERGVQPAIADFLATPTGARFVRHDLAIYGMTANLDGWLEAIDA